MASLHWMDYAVFVVYLVISLAIGVYYACSGGRQSSTKEFISGNNALPLIPTMLSMFVSYLSAVALLGLCAEVYDYGINGVILFALAKLIGSIVAERLVVPFVYRLKMVSMYEYLGRRYNSLIVRTIGVALGLFYMLFYIGACLYAPAVALQAVTGFSTTTTVILLASVSAVYTAIGGMKAVIWTDVFQSAVLFVGLLCIMAKAMLMAGGFVEAFSLAKHHGRLASFSLSVDPRERHTLFGATIGQAWLFTVMFSLTQTSVQRYCALPTLAKARRAVILNVVPFLLFNLIAILYGVAVFAFYAKSKCDPKKGEMVSYGNQILPFFVWQAFAEYPGIAGLFIAALFSGAMSSVSSALSSCAAIAWRDIFLICKPNLTDQMGVRLNKIAVLVCIVLGVCLSFATAAMPFVPFGQAVHTLMAVSCGPLGALYVMGGAMKRANRKGALCGVCAGVVLTLWLCVGAMTIHRSSYHPLPPVSTDNCDQMPRLMAHTAHTAHMNHTAHTPAPAHHLSTTANTSTGPGALDRSTHVMVNATGSSRNTLNRYKGLENFYGVSYMWYCLFGTIVTLLVGVPVSWLTYDAERDKVDNNNLFLKWSDIWDFTCLCRDKSYDLTAVTDDTDHKRESQLTERL